jgi:hypothetical protein
MKQLIFDYLCDLCDDEEVEGLVDSNVWNAAEYISIHFDNTEIYDQIDRLLEAYLAKK